MVNHYSIGTYKIENIGICLCDDNRTAYGDEEYFILSGYSMIDYDDFVNGDFYVVGNDI